MRTSITNDLGCLHRRIATLLVALLLSLSFLSATFAGDSKDPETYDLEVIQQMVDQCSPEHPRLFATKKELTGLSEVLEEDSLRGRFGQLIVGEAQKLLNKAPVERIMTGRRLLSISRECLQRVTTLAAAYYLTGDAKYAERCQQEMLAAARFNDWNPSHFLDVAEMTLGLAIGYDWLYDYLDDASRQEIRQAIVVKGVELAFDETPDWWVVATNNWGQVCHAGLTCGALAVLEDEPELAAKTVHSAVQNVVHSMRAYAPRGSYPEGPMYWGYGTTFNVVLIAALESALGTDFELTNLQGFEQTGGYLALVTGPSGETFDYADGRSTRDVQPALFWFASRFQRPDWLRGESDRWKRMVDEKRRSPRLAALALLWMKQQGKSREIHLPHQWTSGGVVPISIHRSSWDDSEATFFGLKAGSPTGNHGHMDIGSFVLDCDGVRWAEDIGLEPYHGIESQGMNLWSSVQDSDRWTIFRLNNFSHNTLVIDDQLQKAAGNSEIVEFSTHSPSPYSIVDMSDVYSTQASTARRGMALLPSREVVIQDELRGLKPGSRVRWGMVTPGEPSGLGTNELTLRQRDKQLSLLLDAPEKVTWQKIDVSNPMNEWDSPNPGLQMVMFEAEAPDSGELILRVVATPGSCTEPLANKLPQVSLDEWKEAGKILGE